MSAELWDNNHRSGPSAFVFKALLTTTKYFAFHPRRWLENRVFVFL